MRSFFLAIILGLAVVSSSAQGFYGGVIGGLVFSQVDGDDYGGYRKIGIQGGFYVRYEFNEKMSLTTKLRYVPKGSFFKGDRNQSRFKISLHYIDLPVSVGYQIFENFELSAGLSLGVLSKYQVEDATGVIPNDKLYYKRFDINGLIGTLYHITENISVSLEYAYSLSPINKRLKPQRNNLLLTSLRYRF